MDMNSVSRRSGPDQTADAQSDLSLTVCICLKNISEDTQERPQPPETPEDNFYLGSFVLVQMV